jgi:nucleoside-diphosphate-sugar epimerase
MPRTLVTGGTGFVGSNLIASLRRRGWEVRALVRDARRAEALRNLGIELHAGALADEGSLERAVVDVDYVFHVAGRVRALHPREFHEDNVEGTRRLVAACAAQPRPPVVVYVSSLAAGGPSQRNRPRDETDPPEPISEYGQSKLAAERAATSLAEEVPLSIVRPPIVFGPGDSAGLALFRSVHRARVHVVPGLRNFLVSLVYVGDLCDALVRVAENGARVERGLHDGTGIYYVAADRSVSYADFGRLAATAVGRGALVLPVPKFLFWLAGGATELLGRLRRRPAVLNLDKVREAVASGWECNDEKLRRELGYQPARPLEADFIETANWYRENNWL